jgi:hypothetical protein
MVQYPARSFLDKHILEGIDLVHFIPSMFSWFIEDYVKA